MTMITPSLVPSSDPLVTAASVLEFGLLARSTYRDGAIRGGLSVYLPSSLGVR